MPDETTYNVSLSLPQAQAETLAAALTELLWPPAEAVGFFDNEDGTWRVEASFSERPDSKALGDFFAAHGAGDCELSFGDVPPADWVSITQSNLHPLQAGRFLIHGSHDRACARANQWAIEINAGQAFGTAHHGSTLGCLQAIDALAKCERVKSVLDIGTGTGILAIAAARAWPARIVASDIDPVAVAIAEQNIRLNRAATSIRTVVTAGLGHQVIRTAAPFDLVIANILARPLMHMANDIAQATRLGGMIILSGITCDQAEGVLATYGAAGFTRLRRFTNSEWVTLVLRRARIGA